MENKFTRCLYSIWSTVELQEQVWEMNPEWPSDDCCYFSLSNIGSPLVWRPIYPVKGRVWLTQDILNVYQCWYKYQTPFSCLIFWVICFYVFIFIRHFSSITSNIVFLKHSNLWRYDYRELPWATSFVCTFQRMTLTLKCFWVCTLNKQLDDQFQKKKQSTAFWCIIKLLNN